MLPSPCEVLPGEGFGPLRFGLTMAEVETMLGEAPRSYFEEDGAYSYHFLDYPDVGVILFFHQDDDFRLSSIEIEFVLSATLFGVLLFPMSKADVMSLLRSNLQETDLAKITEDCYHPFAQRSLHVPALRGDFYFDPYDALEEFHWGPFYGPDDEVIWPTSRRFSPDSGVA